MATHLQAVPGVLGTKDGQKYLSFSVEQLPFVDYFKFIGPSNDHHEEVSQDNSLCIGGFPYLSLRNVVLIHNEWLLPLTFSPTPLTRDPSLSLERLSANGKSWRGIRWD